MSNRPGIGASAMWEVASELMRHGLDVELDDVPTGLRHGRRVMPLGKYLRRILRERIGRDPQAPQAVLDQMAEEMRDLHTRAEAIAAATPGLRMMKGRIFKSLILDNGQGERNAVLGRQKIFKQRKSL